MISRVSIIILNWNGWQDTIECLESLYQIDYQNYDVIVVDNRSTDDSVRKIKDYCSGKIIVNSKFFKYDSKNKPIEVLEYEEDYVKEDQVAPPSLTNRGLILIKNSKNYGFAKGNNIAIKYALRVLRPDYILLLNNDTVVDRAFLKELVSVMESDPRIGIAGPKIYYYDYGGRSDVISFTGEDVIAWRGVGKRYGCNEVDRGQWDKPMEVDRLEGSCMLIKREVFERIGLFDERFFLYWEETDFCIRAKRAGFKIVYCPRARIWHKVARSMGGNISYMRVYFLTRNRFLFIKKNFPEHFWKFVLYLALYEFWRRVGAFSLYYRRAEALMAYLKGLIDGYSAAMKV
jgi:GT2 family glycosyltransferase